MAGEQACSPEKVPFSLTHVRYVRGDALGFASALLSLAPVFIVVAYATLLVSRRELHVTFLLAGQLANVGLNAVLKASLNRPRPPTAERTDPGMPSDHAQFMFFWASYICLFLLVRVRFTERAGWRALLGGAVVLLAVLVAAARVYLGEHTGAQVAAGGGVGALTGAAWYALYEASVRPNAAQLLAAARPLSAYLYVRDCSHIADVVAFEHRAVDAERARAARGRKGGSGRRS